MNSFHLILLSTFTNSRHIGELVESISSLNDRIKIFHIIVNQSSERISYPKSELYQVHEIETFKIISLSKARNIGIEFLEKSNITADHIMFPDDDAFFKKHFFENFKSQINPRINYLIDVKASDGPGFMKEVKRETGQDILDSDFFSVSSINMIIAFESFKSVGLFNLLLSVGAKYGSSEDLEYFIRINRHSSFISNKNLQIFHPKDSLTFKGLTYREIMKRFNNYGRGFFYVVGEFGMYKNGITSIIRGFGGSAVQLLKLNLTLSFAYFTIALKRIGWLIYFGAFYTYKTEQDA